MYLGNVHQWLLISQKERTQHYIPPNKNYVTHESEKPTHGMRKDLQIIYLIRDLYLDDINGPLPFNNKTIQF